MFKNWVNNFINELFENIVVRLNIEEKKFMNSDRKWASKHDDDEKKTRNEDALKICVELIMHRAVSLYNFLKKKPF